MKSILLHFAFWGLAIQFNSAFTAEPSQTLDPVIERALSQGEDTKLNVSFARTLGLKAEQPIPLKRLKIEKGGVTHFFSVLQNDRNTIILTEIRPPLGTFYLTDRPGNLKRAMVNDSTVVKGGLTNLARATATPGFNREKELWSKQRPN